MIPQSGQTLSHYRLLEKIGEGGMGLVYRAYDTRLKRDVAVKLLPAGALSGELSRKRFHKEALALSRLNHPNIAVVHDFDTQDGVDFLVMEFIPGLTLVDKLAAGPLLEREVLQHGIQLAEALAAAHSEGVVHRDLKPGNLRITPDGRLKILDFGLAKLLRAASETATTESLTDALGPVGTLPYMAPEQIGGGAASTRSDIYSLGAVLYEMATGRRPFSATDRHRLVSAILHEAPVPPGELNRRISPGLERTILKAMDKDPERRYQSAREVRVDLERLSAPVALVVPSHRRALPRWWPLPVAGAALAIAMVVILFMTPRKREDVSNPTMTALVTWPGEDFDSRISTDRQWVSFASNRTGQDCIWLRKLSGGEPQPMIPQPGSIASHIWSPDSGEIALLNLLGDKIFLRIVPAFGGPPRKSVRLEETFLSADLVRWIGSHIYIEVPRSGLWRFDVETERLQNLMAANAEAGMRSHIDVCEDEKRAVFTAHDGRRMSLWATDLDGGNPEELTPGQNSAFRAHWMGPGCRNVVFTSDRSGQRDLWRMSVADRSFRRITFSSGAKYVEDAALDGSLLIFSEDQDSANLWRMDPRGDAPRRRQLTAESLQDYWASAAASARTVVFQRSKPALAGAPNPLSAQILLAQLNLSGLVGERMVVSDGAGARLSPDGNWLAYVKGSQRKGYELWLQDLVSGDAWCVAERFHVSRLSMHPVDWVDVNLSWSSDGETLFCVVTPEAGADEIKRSRPRLGNRGSEAIVTSAEPSDLRDLQPSHDGRYLSYVRSVGKGPTVSELHSLDLVSREDRVLFSRSLDARSNLFARGWVEDDSSLIALTAVTNSDWTQRIEVHEVRLSGRSRLMGTIERGFGGTARLDARAHALYLTKADDAGPAHNLWAFGLDDGKLRRLTDNTLVGISFSGIETLPDGTFLYSQLVKNESIWLIRFAQ